MIVHCKYDELVNPSDLKPHPKNRNKHPKDQIKRLAEILEYQGWRYPIKVSKRSGLVTSGHGRIQAAKVNNWEQVPVNYQDYESDEQEYADVQADNAIASWAELDLSSINTDLEDLGPDFNVDFLGIRDFTIEPADKYKTDEDDVPEQVEATTKLGQIFQLGEHRLMCGDATKDIPKLLNSVKPDMAFADPPYNLGYKYESYQDNKSDSEYISFCGTWFSELLANSSRQIITSGTKNIHMWCEIKEPTHIGCWVKKNWITSCKVSSLQQWEPVFFYGEFNRKARHSDLFEINRTYQKDVGDKHTCPKQIEFMIAVLSWAGKTVLDPFGGSGSTLIACEKTNRKCYMMEIEPKYCDVIIKRWEDYTGSKAQLVT